jgi:Derlin-2/3
LSFSLKFAILYVWSKKEMDMTVTYWGFAIKAYQVPFCFMLLTLLLGGSLLNDIYGIIAGHIYYFFADLAPDLYGWNLVRTPMWFRRIFDKTPEAGIRPNIGTFAGMGQRLGGD